MTVDELIKQLMEHDPKMEVVIPSYGGTYEEMEYDTFTLYLEPLTQVPPGVYVHSPDGAQAVILSLGQDPTEKTRVHTFRCLHCDYQIEVVSELHNPLMPLAAEHHILQYHQDQLKTYG